MLSCAYYIHLYSLKALKEQPAQKTNTKKQQQTNINETDRH